MQAYFKKAWILLFTNLINKWTWNITRIPNCEPNNPILSPLQTNDTLLTSYSQVLDFIRVIFSNISDRKCPCRNSTKNGCILLCPKFKCKYDLYTITLLYSLLGAHITSQWIKLHSEKNIFTCTSYDHSNIQSFLDKNGWRQFIFQKLLLIIFVKTMHA